MTDSPKKIYAIFVPNEDKMHIRKWAEQPFEGACEYVLSSTPESRNKAIDELVKHDQELGRYDTPEWGE